MHRPVVLAAAGLTGLVMIAGVFFWWVQDGPETIQGEWHERDLVFLFDVHNEAGEVREGEELQVFVPPDIENRQRLVAIESNRDVEVTDAVGGNSLASIDLGRMAPHGSRHVRVRMRLEIRDRAAANGAAAGGGGLTRFPVEHPEIAARSAGLTTDDPLETLRNIHGWVDRHMEDIGYVRRDRGALYALREAKGDCTEYMSLVSTLALSAGVDVRAVGGFTYNDSRVARAADYHNWSEADVDGQWWVVDALYGDFTERTDGHVIVRDLASPETQQVGSQGIFLPLEGFAVRMH